MQPLSVVGSGAVETVRSLVPRLDGRVAAVRGTESGPDTGIADGGVAAHEPAADLDADTTIELGADGSWTGGGADRSFTDLLEALAPTHDYVLAAGFSRLRVPTVVLTGEDGTAVDPADVAGEVVATAATPAELDLDGIVADLAGFEPYVTLEELVREAKASPMAERSGAIATFTGRVRMKDAPDDDPTEQLVFEKYEGVAEERMDEIAAELESREGIFEVLMHHRTGVIEAGEDIVFVVVLAGHRKQAFRAVEDGIDLLKEDVPIFKKESTESEEFWVHQRK
ncbi:MAG: molybdopterin synthase [Haloferacaceae archaeon]